jgi:hypothetical protein
MWRSPEMYNSIINTGMFTLRGWNEFERMDDAQLADLGIERTGPLFLLDGAVVYEVPRFDAREVLGRIVKKLLSARLRLARASVILGGFLGVSASLAPAAVGEDLATSIDNEVNAGLATSNTSAIRRRAASVWRASPMQPISRSTSTAAGFRTRPTRA